MGEYGEPQSRNETILQNMLGEDYPMLEPQSRIEVLLQALLTEWQDISTDLNDKVSKSDLIGTVPEALANKKNINIGYSNNIDNNAGGANVIVGNSNSVIANDASNVAVGSGLICPITGQALYGVYNDNTETFGKVIIANGMRNNKRHNAIVINSSNDDDGTAVQIKGSLEVTAPYSVILGYASQDLLTDEYDNTKTYSVGDYCLHNPSNVSNVHRRKLYRCTTAIDTPEEWTAEHWTETTVMGEIKRLIS